MIIQSCTLLYTLHLSNKYIKLHLLFSIILQYKVVQGLLSHEQEHSKIELMAPDLWPQSYPILTGHFKCGTQIPFEYQTD